MNRLAEFARGQAGYFTARQALQAGFSWRVQHYHVHRGHWDRIERAIFRLRGFPHDRYEDLIRCHLWSEGRAIVSHDTAASVHELGDFLPARIHLTIDPEFRKRIPPGIHVYRQRLPANDVKEGPGFRITTPLRTIIDLLGSFSEPDWTTGAVLDAVARGVTTLVALRAAVVGMGEHYVERSRHILAAAEDRLHALQER